jgi:hypothetical protein
MCPTMHRIILHRHRHKPNDTVLVNIPNDVHRVAFVYESVRHTAVARNVSLNHHHSSAVVEGKPLSRVVECSRHIAAPAVLCVDVDACATSSSLGCMHLPHDADEPHLHPTVCVMEAVVVTWWTRVRELVREHPTCCTQTRSADAENWNRCTSRWNAPCRHRPLCN